MAQGTLLNALGDLKGKSEREQIYSRVSFPGGSDGKESAHSVGDLSSVPGWEDPPEERTATHSSMLAWRIPMDRGASEATVHGSQRVKRDGVTQQQYLNMYVSG